MELVIGNKVIQEPIRNILLQLKSECNNHLLHDISNDDGYNVKITCPCHKGGQERHPSCAVYSNMLDEHVCYGTVHCFTCGYTATLPQLVGDCFGEDVSYGEKWLVGRYGDVFIKRVEYLLPIEPKVTKVKKYLDESILDKYNMYHPYMTQRKLTAEVLRKFKVGYDKETDALTFPIWDIAGNLVSITRRSVSNKRFELQEDIGKDVYLLNFLVKEHCTTAYVCESQINALTLHGWGYPGIALLGTGSKEQYGILNKSGIRHFVLCFDGDQPGRNGAARFKSNIRKDVIVTDIHMPLGKDINDITLENFQFLLQQTSCVF